jgi:hypothetical protein
MFEDFRHRPAIRRWPLVAARRRHGVHRRAERVAM